MDSNSYYVDKNHFLSKADILLQDIWYRWIKIILALLNDTDE